MLSGWLAGLALWVLQAALGLLFFTLKGMEVEVSVCGGIHISRGLIGSDLCFERKHHPGCLRGWMGKWQRMWLDQLGY